MYKKLSDKEKIAKNKFNGYTNKRILCKQKLDLEMIQYYIDRDDLYDIKDIKELLEDIISANIILSRRIKQHETQK